MNNKFAAIIILISFPFILHAQREVVSATLSADTIMIGDQISLRIKIDSPAGSDPRYMVQSENGFANGIEIIGSSGDTLLNDTGRTYLFDFLITSFDSGIYSIPGIPVVNFQRENPDTLFTNALGLVVLAPLIDTTASVKDIKQPINTPFTIEEILPYLSYGALGVVTIALIFSLLWFAFSRKKISFKPEIVIPPHEKAIHKLEYLKKEKLWQKGQLKEHYTILSDTIRIYIEESFGIKAMESITWEILRDFRKYAYDDGMLLEMLESLLNMSDLVKFAREDPSPSENETNLNKAYIFIEKTRPVKIEESTKTIEEKQ